VNEIAAETGIDLVQLSGSEPWSDCLLVNRPAINVLRPQPGTPPADILAQVQPGAAIAFMLDSSRGTGAVGDWRTASAIAERLPVWLAGGLTPQNVARTIREVRPWAVDVSSGVETDGAKDAAKIAAFVRAGREADAHERRSRSHSMRLAEPRKDRSSDLSALPVRPPVGTRHTTYPRRGSSPRASNFDYTGGHAYHVVFLTDRRIRHFSEEAWARAATEELRAASTHTGFSLAAYCVMPDHIHVLLEGDAALRSDLRRFAHRFKQVLGFRFKQSTAKTLWHRSYYDHVVRPDEPLEAHAAYILGNPVRAGLVDTVDAWPFSGPPGMLAAPRETDRSEDLSLRLVTTRLDTSFEGMPSP
jgi:REP element-mobilizing transposase RayT